MLEVCTSSEMLQKKEKKNPTCIVAPPTTSLSPPPLLFTLLNYLLAFLSSAGGQAPGICQCVFVCVFFCVCRNEYRFAHKQRRAFSSVTSHRRLSVPYARPGADQSCDHWKLFVTTTGGTHRGDGADTLHFYTFKVFVG